MKKCHNAAQRSASMRSLHYGNIICEYLTARLGFDFSVEPVGASYYQFSIHSFKLRQPKPLFSTHIFGQSSISSTSTQPSSSAPSPSSTQPPSTSGVESLFTAKFVNFIVDSFRELGEKTERNYQQLLSQQAQIDSQSAFLIEIVKVVNNNSDNMIDFCTKILFHLKESKLMRDGKRC
ncbi:hypothetical protein AXF42_Ash005410 [Apostasia shenzhenica]|uniref:Uncharacterized protein n=1 Tax=Apostasia shenzhenica TaxID=1088818 RepID=A0A2I0B6V2_9ASPA|nr:hypothetical protein AXF42_Ash005410 [Apostasia shenzhenica]